MTSETNRYEFGHAWHYYIGGDGARLPAISKLPTIPPVQPSKLSRLFAGRTARARLRSHVRKELARVRRILASEQASNAALRRRGFKSLHELDRSMRAEEPKLAVAIAGAMLVRCIVGTRAEVAWCEEYLDGATARDEMKEVGGGTHGPAEFEPRPPVESARPLSAISNKQTTRSES